MQTTLIKTAENNKQLILYFAGWGTPASAVGHLTLPENTDLLLCYDYQDLHFEQDLSAYQQIRLVAWSMGVWVAEQVMGQLPLISATAINGTGKPCDDEMGIPQAVFVGTLEQLNERNLTKFQRRMCGDSDIFQHYQKLAEQRDWQKVHSELTALYHAMQQTQGRQRSIQWTKAIVGEKDRIFPVQNQLSFWQAYQAERVHIAEEQRITNKSAVQNEAEFSLQTLALPHYPFTAFQHWAELF
ncbi:DUF452 family protein [Avibacterium paragallinarum]|uniref:DUF452 family protein n=1 Tax=Avibacterium paragallinarum TaxID=728 RepID=A0A0F5EQ81_AVIPA|nr:pimeloyl-ACP methyl esterase BioG family protein [Avibacterium paragallinarum]AZI13718.1 DUF452 family protein [Avibacterium paragallinarum]KAA6208391.1 DUF452 family protein [Avibacterium paragallinarum]KKB01736.1 hypothetical protein Z012_04875 [Avibacterium paragallinarum]QIR11966.1 DUF452 family protein [Avibacterium paragallinarum]QJE09214.1 DUF452 family protein [Avibacterium paragallinarum]